ncbi:hypothetical protein [Comamonas testosteroni]|jgi:hypothetical protein|uniref:hypothetical protein n=1 Tax=Comamonas testosteroni TaxID=285 RepID=UPI0026F357A0|nr:hypothetical protein [Comamonas testosteroni]
MATNDESKAIKSTSVCAAFPWRLLVIFMGCLALLVGIVMNINSDPYSKQESISALICSLGMFAFALSFLLPGDNF